MDQQHEIHWVDFSETNSQTYCITISIRTRSVEIQTCLPPEKPWVWLLSTRTWRANECRGESKQRHTKVGLVNPLPHAAGGRRRATQARRQWTWTLQHLPSQKLPSFKGMPFLAVAGQFSSQALDQG